MAVRIGELLLKEKRITPAHLQEAYRDPAYSEGSFPEAERASREVLALPIFPTITREAVERVASLIRAD